MAESVQEELFWQRLLFDRNSDLRRHNTVGYLSMLLNG